MRPHSKGGFLQTQWVTFHSKASLKNQNPAMCRFKKARGSALQRETLLLSTQTALNMKKMDEIESGKMWTCVIFVLENIKTQ